VGSNIFYTPPKHLKNLVMEEMERIENREDPTRHLSFEQLERISPLVKKNVFFIWL
jgi:hypothetical protein